MNNEQAARLSQKDQNQVDQKDIQSSSITQSLVERVAELTKQEEYEEALKHLSEIFRNLPSTSRETDDVLRAFLVFQMGQFSLLLERSGDSAYSFEYIVDHFKDSEEPIIRKIYIDTLKSQAFESDKNNRLNEALEKLDTGISYLQDLEQRKKLDQDKYLSYEDIIRFQLQRGVILRDSDQLLESLTVLRIILESDRVKSGQRYRSIREKVQIELGVALRKSGQIEESVQIFKDVIKSVTSNEPSPWKTNSIRAYREIALTQLSDSPLNALETIEKVIQSVEKGHDEGIQVELAELMKQKAGIESTQNNEEAAFATWGQIYDRFRDSRDFRVCSIVSDSLIFQGAFAVSQERWGELQRLSNRLNRFVRKLPNIPLFSRSRFFILFFRVLGHVFLDGGKSEKRRRHLGNWLF